MRLKRNLCLHWILFNLQSMPLTGPAFSRQSKLNPILQSAKTGTDPPVGFEQRANYRPDVTGQRRLRNEHETEKPKNTKQDRDVRGRSSRVFGLCKMSLGCNSRGTNASRATSNS